MKAQRGLENTVVIFFSDTGPTKLGSTAGLRGTKGNGFEGGIRVPCIIRYPKKIAAGSVSDQPFLSMDLTASILSLADAIPSQPLDGIDLIETLAATDLKPEVENRPLFWRKRRGDVTVKAMRQESWKLVVQHNGDQTD